jgi:hypothetical protein
MEAENYLLFRKHRRGLALESQGVILRHYRELLWGGKKLDGLRVSKAKVGFFSIIKPVA